MVEADSCFGSSGGLIEVWRRNCSPSRGFLYLIEFEILLLPVCVKTSIVDISVDFIETAGSVFQSCYQTSSKSRPLPRIMSILIRI